MKPAAAAYLEYSNCSAARSPEAEVCATLLRRLGAKVSYSPRPPADPLAPLSRREREIGVRMAVGASRREILTQFLTEAVMISVGGGLLGIVIGVAMPLSVQLFVDNIHIPVSIWSVVIAFTVSSLVGLVFGMLPASRASKLHPTEALRYE